MSVDKICETGEGNIFGRHCQAEILPVVGEVMFMGFANVNDHRVLVFPEEVREILGGNIDKVMAARILNESATPFQWT